MPYRVVRFEDTPNPNAVKCVLDRPVATTTRSYRDKPAPGSDPLADCLFAIDGVTNLLFVADWVTVSKEPRKPWRAVKSAVEKALANAP